MPIDTSETWRSTFEHTDAQCADCGYHLRGLTHPRCPECGEVISIESLRAEPRPPVLWGVALLPLLLLAMAAGAACLPILVGGIFLLAYGRRGDGAGLLLLAAVCASIVALELWWVRNVKRFAAAPVVLWLCALGFWGLLFVVLTVLGLLTALAVD